MKYRNRSEPGRELRLALVMNGGVSLAVWISGVTHGLPTAAAPTHRTTSRAERVAEASGLGGHAVDR